MRLRQVIYRDIAYWIFITILFGSSVIFTYQAESKRRELAKTRLENCITDNVSLEVVNVLDGDELLVKTNKSKEFIVHLLGIKAFSQKSREQEISKFGKRAISELKTTIGQQVHLRFNTFKRDSQGRVWAYLEENGTDVGKKLIKAGFAVVCERYPFERLEDYLADERIALRENRGLWANAKARQRSFALKNIWEAMSSDL